MKDIPQINLKHTLTEILKERILVLDGAMGTMIQRYKLTEKDYRGEQFKDHPCEVKGNNDMLSITQPHIIQEIHAQYLEVGSDIIETNTFSSNSVSMADYEMEDWVYQLRDPLRRRSTVSTTRMARVQWTIFLLKPASIPSM